MNRWIRKKKGKQTIFSVRSNCFGGFFSKISVTAQAIIYFQYKTCIIMFFEINNVCCNKQFLATTDCLKRKLDVRGRVSRSQKWPTLLLLLLLYSGKKQNKTSFFISKALLKCRTLKRLSDFILWLKALVRSANCRLITSVTESV